MKKTYLIILISSFVFIAINTLFYFTIYNQQLEFQTELLTRQTQLCGSGIEQEGLSFENELNYIPFADDFSRLFTDEGVRERGAENLKKLYTKYSELIKKVTVFDNNNNVYSIILDLKNNFVSDYYESQYQSDLMNRDQLITEEDGYLLSIPDFDQTGIVRSNIVIDLDFESYVNSIFEKYLLEGTTWPWLVSENGELLTSADKDIVINQGDLDRVSAAITEGEEGWMVHSINVDSSSAKVVSVYYPIRLIKRDLAIVFSMKTDIFLRTIIIKFVIITICSLILLALLLFIHFRVVKVKSDTDYAHRISEESLRKTVNALPIGLILAGPGGDIRLMNLSAQEMLFNDVSVAYQQYTIEDLGLDVVIEDGFSYGRFLGQGEIVSINRGKGNVSIYKRDWTIQIGNVDTRIVLLFDISALEKTRNLNRVAKRAKNELLRGMIEEIEVPVAKIQENLSQLKALKPSATQKDQLDSMQKSQDLLFNLIKIFADFSSQDALKVVLEEIPFSLQGEINMALDPYKAIANGFNSSIITKIRSEIPDRVIGDPFRLRKLVSGLVETSLDLTENGRILISAEILEYSPDLVKIQFQVEDTGKGLNAEEIERLMLLPANEALEIPDELERIVLRLAVARQYAELMKGQLWFESPSSISTDPKSPGAKYSFNIEVKPESQEHKQFTKVQQYSDIQCLVLSQKKDSPEAGQFKLLGEMGLNLKFLIYRPDNLDSVLDLVREKSANMHMLLLIDSEEENGFDLAEKLSKSGIPQNLIRLLFSSRTTQENKEKSQELGMDYFISVPFESHRLYEIISTHFPLIPLKEAHEAPKGNKIDPNISILLAEDNLFNRRVAQALFKSVGFEIDLANNGKDVMDMLEQKKYDIIFMDLLMPEMDGLEATEAIRKLGYEMPIIALTAVDDNDTRAAANNAGVNDYLLKPATAENIREILLRTFSKIYVVIAPLMLQDTEIITFLDLAKNHSIVDVRTPAEYKQGRIPTAHNIPLFTDAERKSVGTTYKKKGRQSAILEGLEYAGPRLKSYILKARKLATSNKLLLHCWRGGMRSSAMAWLLHTYGIQCHVLQGGYKSFRNRVLTYCENAFPFVVIGGLTGSGKTDVLRALASMGEQILDLEGLSHHKGSVFGHLGEAEQNSNEQFENEIFWNLVSLDRNKIIWLEDESRNIGKNTLPGGIFAGIRNAPVIFLDVPAEVRINRLVDEYAAFPDDQIVAAIEKISSRLGGKAAGEAIKAVRSGDYQKSTELVLGYYDKTYGFGLGKRQENKVFKLGIEMPFTGLSMAAKILDFSRENAPSWKLSN